jgi:hypothetical protein
MKLKTASGEVYFNPLVISHMHLNSDRSLLTVHFVNGTHFGFPADTDEERLFFAEFLGKLSDDHSGFVAIGNEVLNLKSALWVAIPDDGPIQIRTADGRARPVDDKDRERICKLLGE